MMIMIGAPSGFLNLTNSGEVSADTGQVKLSEDHQGLDLWIYTLVLVGNVEHFQFRSVHSDRSRGTTLLFLPQLATW